MAADTPSFRKRVLTLTRTTTGSVIGTIGVGGPKYFRCNQFRAKVTSSGATGQVELKDAKGRVFYKDAADLDYQTANVDRWFTRDQTVTGLGFTVTDATGAALNATAGDLQQGPYGPPICEGPITVTWADADGIAGNLRLELILEV